MFRFFVQLSKEGDLAVFTGDRNGGFLCFALWVGQCYLQLGLTCFERDGPVAGGGIDGTGHRVLVAGRNGNGGFVVLDGCFFVLDLLDGAIGAEVFGFGGDEDHFFFALSITGEAGRNESGG